jgi:hypothetical protein
MHAYDLMIIYGISGIFGLLLWVRDRAFPWKLFWGGMILAVISCSGAVYSVILTRVDPLWKEVLAQFPNAGIFTPSPLHMAMLFGIPLLLAIPTCIALAIRKHWQDANLFVMGWFLGGAVISYIPTVYQIHMLNSWQIPMMILAAIGLHDFIIPWMKRWHVSLPAQATRWALAACFLAILPTNVYLWSWRFIELHRHTYSYYLYRDELAALGWLKQNTPREAVILASETIGQYVPVISGNTAFLAHWAQTVGYYDKVNRVNRFFDTAGTNAERAQTLRAYNVAYIFWGPAERQSGGYDPSSTNWLELVYENPKVSVFRVQATELPMSAP